MQWCDADGFALPAVGGAQGTLIPTPPTQLLAALFAGPVAPEVGAAQGTLTPAPPMQVFDGGIGAGRVGSGAASATEIVAMLPIDAAANARRFKYAIAVPRSPSPFNACATGTFRGDGK